MSEYIGSRISLISKSDIRYVGQLHEINSENSTVALEAVKSYGTEGRRGNPEDELPPSDDIYPYIIFRGSDVKDLRIEKPTAEEPPPKPKVPDDPAILSGSRPGPPGPPGPPNAPQNFPQPPPPGPRHDQSRFPPQYPFQQQQYGQPPNQRFGGPGPGFGGPPGPPGGPPGYPQFGAPYGPQGWYPPPGPGFNQGPPPFSPPQNHLQPQGPGPQNKAPPTVPSDAPIEAPAGQRQQLPPANAKAPTPPLASKPDIKPELPGAPAQTAKVDRSRTAQKVALPMPAGGRPPRQQAAPTTSAQPKPVEPATNASDYYQDATRKATAAVAAAMAKLPPGPSAAKSKPTDPAMTNLTQKVNEMRTDDRNRSSRGQTTSTRARGSSTRRGSGRDHTSKALEVPKTDFDFESANAKFNKEDLVKEAIASGEPITTAVAPAPTNGTSSINGSGAADTSDPTYNGDGARDDADPIIPPASYTKSSFFDNISSELKDREEGKNTSTTASSARGGRGNFRSDERKRNIETFGAGSVDSGGSYGRGGYRGRGRGRGYRGSSSSAPSSRGRPQGTPATGVGA